MIGQFADAYPAKIRDLPQACWKHITERQWISSLQYNSIDIIPLQCLTRNIYIHAVSGNPSLYRKLPREMQTLEFFVDVVLTTQQNVSDFAYLIPRHLKTPQFYMALWKAGDVNASRYLGKQMTPEMVDITIEKSGQTIDFLPNELRTCELIFKAIKTYPQAVLYLDSTRENCKTAYEINPEIINCLEGEFKDYLVTEFQIPPPIFTFPISASEIHEKKWKPEDLERYRNLIPDNLVSKVTL